VNRPPFERGPDETTTAGDDVQSTSRGEVRPGQVELDALPPDVLRRLDREAVAEFWDASTYEAVLSRESSERAVLRQLTGEVAS